MIGTSHWIARKHPTNLMHVAELWIVGNIFFVIIGDGKHDQHMNGDESPWILWQEQLELLPNIDFKETRLKLPRGEWNPTTPSHHKILRSKPKCHCGRKNLPRIPVFTGQNSLSAWWVVDMGYFWPRGKRWCEVLAENWALPSLANVSFHGGFIVVYILMKYLRGSNWDMFFFFVSFFFVGKKKHLSEFRAWIWMSRIHASQGFVTGVKVRPRGLGVFIKWATDEITCMNSTKLRWPLYKMQASETKSWWRLLKLKCVAQDSPHQLVHWVGLCWIEIPGFRIDVWCFFESLKLKNPNFSNQSTKPACEVLCFSRWFYH